MVEERERVKQIPKKLKIVAIILAVLLGLSAGGLIGRYIYLAFFAPAQSTATVPDNLIGEKSPSAPAESGTEASDSTASAGSGLPSENITSGILAVLPPGPQRTSSLPPSWNCTRASRATTGGLKRAICSPAMSKPNISVSRRITTRRSNFSSEQI